IGSLDGKENRRGLADKSGPVFAVPPAGNPNGHLLFFPGNTFMAQPFDLQTTQPVGDMFPVADRMATTANGTYAPVSVSENAVLIYENGSISGNNQIVWFDRTGKPLGPASAPGFLANPSISPDEKMIAFRLQSAGVKAGIWLRDSTRGTDIP